MSSTSAWRANCIYIYILNSDSDLSRPVDHGVGDDPGLTKCSSQRQAREDVPAVTELQLLEDVCRCGQEQTIVCELSTVNRVILLSASNTL